MISRKLFIVITSVSVLLAFAASAQLATSTATPSHRTEACWIFETSDLREQAHHADTIVLAKAIATYPSRIAYSDNNEDRLPFQLVEFQVLDGLKGAKASDTIFVERAGGADIDGSFVDIDIDGGEYRSGGTYLLFLRNQPDTGLQCVFNDQGRFELASDGETLISIRGGELASQLHGLRAHDALEKVREATR